MLTIACCYLNLHFFTFTSCVLHFFQCTGVCAFNICINSQSVFNWVFSGTFLQAELNGWLKDLKWCRSLALRIQSQIRLFHSSLFRARPKLSAALGEGTAEFSVIIVHSVTIHQRFHHCKLFTSCLTTIIIPCYHICFWSYHTEDVTMSFSLSVSLLSIHLYSCTLSVPWLNSTDSHCRADC